jgi:hypothetical protein
MCKRLARGYEAIDDQTDPAQLHEVRVTAKKLRYLIDVTSSFYEAEALDDILPALKKLQRVLGDFNDAQVQERRLLEFGRALGAAGGLSNAVLALGQLAERGRQRRDRLRPEAIDQLKQFRAPATRDACRRAFKHMTAGERVR